MIRISTGGRWGLWNKDGWQRIGEQAEHVEVSVFKGGEVNVKLGQNTGIYLAQPQKENHQVFVIANLTSSDEVMAFFLTVDAIRRANPRTEISAYIPYLPYARQDRVCNLGEALSLSMFAKMLNTLDLAEVYLLDPHSDVAGALIERSEIITQEHFLKRILFNRMLGLNPENLCLVAPDAGAVKKTKALAEKCKLPYITASKSRDLATMEITDTKFDGDVQGKNLIVIDDICDGGRTFIELGKKLREAGCGELTLFVTHGIFSYGLDGLMQIYDRVFTTDSFHPNPAGQTRLLSTHYLNSEERHRFYWFEL